MKTCFLSMRNLRLFMINSERLILLPIDVGMIDALLESDDIFYNKYGYINEGGEYLNPSPDYLHKIKERMIEHPEEYPLAVDQLKKNNCYNLEQCKTKITDNYDSVIMNFFEGNVPMMICADDTPSGTKKRESR